MKTVSCLLGAALFMAACVAPPPSAPSRRSSTDHFGDAVAPAGSSSTPLGASVAASTPGPVAASPSGTLRPPDAELIYQSRESDAFGSSTYTSRTQVRGPVVEEIHIGNQRVLPQPGYMPAGTTMIYDPVTGRSIPVRRR